MEIPDILAVEPSVISILTNPSYDEFLQDYLEPNRPCLISPSLTASWSSFSLWIERDERNDTQNINWSYLKDTYGDQVVSVAQCHSRDFSDQERTQRPLAEVIDLWMSDKGDGLYVKDWHLSKTSHHKGLPSFYETPDIFRDDWMNSFWENEGKDDFRFVVFEIKSGSFRP